MTITMVMRHERKAQEKYWNLIQIIDEKRKTANTDEIKLPIHDLVQNPIINTTDTAITLLERLEREGGITVDWHVPSDDFGGYIDRAYLMQVLPKFDSILKKEDKKYTDMAEDYQGEHSPAPLLNNDSSPSNIVKKPFSLAVKEKIARVIGEYFSTNKIMDVFTDANIHPDKSLFAKWRITLDAFNKMSSPHEGISHTLEVFCHPLNFSDSETRKNFIKELGGVLAYENLKIVATDRTAKIVYTDGTPVLSIEEIPIKTSTDYILEALTFFKNEYNKVPMSGLVYEYPLGENINSNEIENGRDEYDEKIRAIEQLKNAQFITEYTIDEREENDGYFVWDYALCKIDENMITQKEIPRATEEKVQELIHKIEITAMPPVELKEPKKENINKFPYKLPAGTKWENFTIKFLDDENIFIRVKHIKHEANYKEMGFVGKGKNPNPSVLWTFLKVLAKVNGELVIKDVEAKDEYKKQKEALAKALQNYFSLDYDPFYPYRSSPEKTGNSYKIKITLIPSPEKNEKEITSEDKDDLGVKEYLDEQAPQVFEDQ